MEWSSQHIAHIQPVTKSLKFGGKHPFRQFLILNYEIANDALASFSLFLFDVGLFTKMDFE